MCVHLRRVCERLVDSSRLRARPTVFPRVVSSLLVIHCRRRSQIARRPTNIMGQTGGQVSQPRDKQTWLVTSSAAAASVTSDYSVRRQVRGESSNFMQTAYQDASCPAHQNDTDIGEMILKLSLSLSLSLYTRENYPRNLRGATDVSRVTVWGRAHAVSAIVKRILFVLSVNTAAVWPSNDHVFGR